MGEAQKMETPVHHGQGFGASNAMGRLDKLQCGERLIRIKDQMVETLQAVTATAREGNDRGLG